MTWETKGESHTVTRNGATQNLDKTKAVGAKAVNAEILKILGINLDVFRIACSAKQGELDKLTKDMRPTERRKMVDEVIGLNSLELVEGLCRKEGNAIKAMRDKLAQRLREPTPPEEPGDYVDSETLDGIHRTQLTIEAERNQLLRIAKPTLPTEPVKGDFQDDVTDHESLRKVKEAERAGIERTLRTIPRTVYTGHDIDYAERYYNQANLGDAPKVDAVQAEQWIKDWDYLERAKEVVTCPQCDLTFIPGETHAARSVEEPPYSRAELVLDLKRSARWEGHTYEDFPHPPVLPAHEIQTARNALSQSETREQLEKELDTLPVMEDRSAELKRKEEYEQALALYQIDNARYLDKLLAWEEAQRELKELPESDPDVEKNLRLARIYEEQMRTYNADMIQFKEVSTELESLTSQAEAFLNGAEALKFVRSQVKQHLVPSLNRVASHLLTEMTNGKRQKIEVDEDFEVVVDGQPVRTLSGSGVSVVNLALRIALGQVLTQRLLPIFLADEIDHDMDPTRAQSTHEAIRKLTTTFNQILVVSHKQIEGDHTIGV